MMPNDIMERASLMDNKHGCVKMALTIVTEIDEATHTPVGKIRLLFTKIKVKRGKLAHIYGSRIPVLQ